VKRFDLLQKMQMEMGAREKAREGEGAVAGTDAMPAATKGAMRAGLTPPLLPGQWRPPIDEPHWVREARELITSHAAEVARMPAGSPVQAAQAALALRMAQEELSGHLSEGDKERMVMRHAQEIREVRAARVAEVPGSQAPTAAQVAPAQGASNKPGEDVSRAGGARTAAVSEKAVPERKGRVARRRPAEMIPLTSNVVEKHRGFGGSWDAKTNCGLRKTELGSE